MIPGLALFIITLVCLWPSPLPGFIERDELNSFLHQWMSEKMDAYHVPGVIVVVVKDGELFHAKGFGVADIENRKPMDPFQTVMRVGSISKLVTATAETFRILCKWRKVSAVRPDK